MEARNKSARDAQIPDLPFFPDYLQTQKVGRYVFLCNVLDVPSGLPKDANPRQQDIDKRIYKDIARHLINEEGTANTFHLKNKGITVLAERIERVAESDQYEIVFSAGQGIVDGAHTYEIILNNQSAILERNALIADEEPEPNDARYVNQFVKIEVITGLQMDIVAEIAAGLNTAVQVQQMALKLDLEGK